MMRAVWATPADTGARPSESASSKYSTRKRSPLSSLRSMAGSPRSMRHPTSYVMRAPGEPLRQSIGHTAAPVRCHLRAPAAHGELARVRPDHGHAGDLVRVQWKEPVVHQQDGALGRDLTGHGAPARVVLLVLLDAGRSCHRAAPTRPSRSKTWRSSSSTRDSSTSPARTAAAREGPSQADGPGISRSRPARTAGDGRVRAEPVRHHEPVETPLIPQDAVDEVRLFAAVDAVHLVVGRHHGPDAGLLYGGLEGDEVDLPQRALGDLGADGHPLELLVVAGIVLDATPDPCALHPLHVGDGQARRQQRVLGEGLEGASGQGRAGDAHCRPEQHVDALGARLGGQHVPQALHQGRVPRRADRHAAGQRQRAPADQAVAPHARRPVGHLERPDAEPLDRREVPEVGAGGEGALLVEGHGLDEALDIELCLDLGPAARHHVSTNARRRSIAQSTRGPAASSTCTKRARVAAGSITSSISKCSATCRAFPCS